MEALILSVFYSFKVSKIMLHYKDAGLFYHLCVAFAFFGPSLTQAAPYMLTDAIPHVEDTQEFESNDIIPQNSITNWEEHNYIDPELVKIFNGDDSAPIQRKRSGLRSALVARMNRGYNSNPSTEDDLDNNFISNIGNHVFYAQPSTMGGNYISRRSQPETVPYLSVGKMSGAKDDSDKNVNSNLNYGIFNDVNRYFKGLQHQLETLVDEPEAAPVSIPGKSSRFFGVSRGGPRPAATAAYLHALRSHGPSHRIRSFVEDPGPMKLRGANNHDPALLWTGLGRRRR